MFWELEKHRLEHRGPALEDSPLRGKAIEEKARISNVSK